MISRIYGRIISSRASDKGYFVEILLQSGVVYQVIVTNRVFRNHKFVNQDSSCDNVTIAEVELFTSFQVREDSQRLYGFLSQEERDMFELLIPVSGIGPKIGMAILECYDVATLVGIIEDSDYTKLMKVSGVGKKTAQKIVLDLQGKLDLPEDFELHTSKQRESLGELKEALEVLGFTGTELDNSMRKGEELLKEDDNLTSEQLLGIVLKT